MLETSQEMNDVKDKNSQGDLIKCMTACLPFQHYNGNFEWAEGETVSTRRKHTLMSSNG